MLSSYLAALWLGSVPVDPPRTTDPPPPPVPVSAASYSTAAATPPPSPRLSVEATGRQRLAHYLRRPVSTSPRFLNHGVVQAGVAGGWPHFYRFQLGLGVLDHVAGGATMHWLPGQRFPRWAPWGSVAFWRDATWAVGLHYRQVLHPPLDDRYQRPGRTPEFEERSHYVVSTLSFSQAWWTVGGDVGVVRRRIATVDEMDEPSVYDEVWRFGGGLYVRAGTPRWGFTAQAQLPSLSAEILFDVRLGAFEARDHRRGWRVW